MYNLHSSLTIATLTLVISVQTVYPANILFFHLVVSASHRISIWPLAEKLANTGHNVTYIYPMEHHRDTHPKIEEIVPSKMAQLLENFIGDFDLNFRLNGSINEKQAQLFSVSVEICKAFYQSLETLEWLAKPNLNYDLILIDGFMAECAYGLVHKFKSKHIIFWPNGYGPWMWDAAGIVADTSSIPDTLYSNTKPNQMHLFKNRLISTLVTFVYQLGKLDFTRRVKPIIQENLKIPKEKMFDLLEIERNTSLILVNANFIEDYPVALPPLIQSYSGLWCSKDKLKERKSLPENLDKFIGNFGSFVYVSLGSVMDSSTMPKWLRDRFFTAFKKFPEFRFLWRWTGDGENIPKNTPKNVLLQNWFPQKDLMADKRIKGFITQTGRISTHDAFCHAVPMIAIPIGGDQFYNANRLEQIGAAIVLDIGNLTTADLQSALTQIVFNDKYKLKMKELSSLFRDRPLDPLENVFYWTEYVLRQNTTHLRPLGMNRHWYERRLLDVYLFFGLLLISIVFMTCYFFKICIGLFIMNRKTKKD